VAIREPRHRDRRDARGWSVDPGHQDVGRDRVGATLERAIAPFRLSVGRYRLENRFWFLLATRD
jgi:hypothetical protein